MQVIEALPEALIGGIYWGLAQVDNGQVHDMVGRHLLQITTHTIFFFEGNEHWMEPFL